MRLPPSAVPTVDAPRATNGSSSAGPGMGPGMQLRPGPGMGPGMGLGIRPGAISIAPDRAAAIALQELIMQLAL